MEQIINERNNQYWLIVWSKITGDFKNAIMKSKTEESIDDVSSRFESDFSEYRVIHIGEGNTPPKTYRSLEYIN